MNFYLLYLKVIYCLGFNLEVLGNLLFNCLIFVFLIIFFNVVFLKCVGCEICSFFVLKDSLKNFLIDFISIDFNY